MIREASKNLWDVDAQLRVITTNGYIKKDGCAVMGRGCAKEARDKYKGMEKRLGSLLQRFGNRPFRLRPDLATLPVKHNWNERADIGLIESSTVLLVELVDKFEYESVVMPRPGCGNGGLEWSKVKPVIEPLLDDRFLVVHYSSEQGMAEEGKI